MGIETQLLLHWYAVDLLCKCYNASNFNHVFHQDTKILPNLFSVFHTRWQTVKIERSLCRRTLFRYYIVEEARQVSSCLICPSTARPFLSCENSV